LIFRLLVGIDETGTVCPFGFQDATLPAPADKDGAQQRESGQVTAVFREANEVLGGVDVDPPGFGQREVESRRRCRVNDAVHSPPEIGMFPAWETELGLRQIPSDQADAP